jgi:hypothetical protein
MDLHDELLAADTNARLLAPHITSTLVFLFTELLNKWLSQELD